jgi:DNA-binding CsgD family transcriptional regulator
MVRRPDRAREQFRHREWQDAYRTLSAADRARGLEAEPLELLASAAYLSGREEESLAAFERAYHAWAAVGQAARAARCASWISLMLLFRNEAGRATGWLGRAERLLDRDGLDCAERGYLLLPVAEKQLASRELDAAFETASRAAAIGERFGDVELTATARHQQGRAFLHQGRVAEGLPLLDECMVAVTGGELSPIMTGLLYCSVIGECLQVHALGRAREWNAAMADWCARQPQLVAFTSTCRVHRSEVLLWSGAWAQAFEEARSACRRSAGDEPGAAHYQQGEVHRLSGELAAAEESYRRASRAGCEPQPGLALLRLAQGRTDAALAAMHRVVGATSDPLERTRLLPAYVEVLLAAGDLEAAGAAARELETIAESFASEALDAMAAQARGAVEIAAGEPQSALGRLRRAHDLWQRLGAPYALARVRELIAAACLALGDEDGSRLELDAARDLLARLGAVPGPDRRARNLTARELQVLALVAAGKTNKRIARELGLSDRTVDRHVSNIFTKLDVSSRAAATAYAYENKLI